MSTEGSNNVISLNDRRKEKNQTATGAEIPKGEDRQVPVEQWLAIRKEEALRINPEIAETYSEHGYIVDPYGVEPNLPDECRCIGRIDFARNPGSDIWVCFYDLPKATRDRLSERGRRGVSFFDFP